MHWFLVFFLTQSNTCSNGVYYLNGCPAYSSSEMRVPMPSADKCEEVKALLKPAIDADCWGKEQP